MEGIVRVATDHPLVTMAVCFAVLLILYFLFKSLIKVALILIIVAVAIVGYLYFQHPESRPANLKDAVEKVRTGVGKAVDRGKKDYEKGKELFDKRKETYEKSKELVDKGKAVLDKGIDKGKDVIDKGKAVLDKGINKGKDAIEKVKDAAGDIGKLRSGDKEAGDRQKP